MRNITRSRLRSIGRALLICLPLVVAAALLRLDYLHGLTDDPNRANVGGDPNHHFNIAWNIAHGRGPVTDFIFSYWFRHPAFPALTDIYPPGVHYVIGAFLTLFGDSYSVARFTCLFFGSIACCAAYFLARQFLPVGLAFLVGATVVLNPVHIEHSTIIMTPIIGSFFVWLILALLLRHDGGNIWKGLLVGWGHLCMSALAPLSLAFVIREFFLCRFKGDRFGACGRRFILYALGVSIALAPWALETYRYFGKPLYTNFAFYPFTSNWVPMNHSTTPPSLARFVESNGGYLGTARLYGSYFLAGLVRSYTQALPLSTPRSLPADTINLSLIALGLVQLFRRDTARALAFLGFFASFLLLLSVGSTANEGYLSSRHVLIFAPLVIIVWALGLQLLFEGAKRMTIRAIPALVQFRTAVTMAGWVVLLVACFAVTRTWRHYFHHWKYYEMEGARETPFSEIFAFHYFWSRRSPELEAATEWIRTNTSPNAVFMYGKTPQDFWAATRRRVVVDPVFAGGAPSRAADEAKFYNVDFLALDSNNTIYPREPLPADVSAAYGGLKLTRVWSNAAGSFVIYKLEK
jgi:hypothetical protein